MQEHNYSIKQWAKDDRPREKLLMKGAENLSDSELLAILIHNGTRERSALDLSRDLLRLAKNNLNELARLSHKDMMKVKGIGEAKAIFLAAALELGRRRVGSTSLPGLVITSSSDIAQYLRNRLGDYRHEAFGVVFLNRANKIKDFRIISEGGITGTVADPRIVLRAALDEDAVALILCHNHPSGSLKPSNADMDLTRKITEAAKYFDIRVLDHVIVSEAGYFSFADEGMI
jgi:DNA repair protein RadC